MQKLTISISGYARAGKDSLCSLLLDEFSKLNISAKRIALADALKNDINPHLIDTYGIDVWNCTPEEKETVRHELVAYGKEKRIASNGTYWTNILEKEIERATEDIIIIPDVRYDFYPEDEVYWAKKNGLLIHVARYNIIDDKKIFLTPPNEDERENDSKVRMAADFSLSWQTLPTDKLKEVYGGFIQTITTCANIELKRIQRHSANQ